MKCIECKYSFVSVLDVWHADYPRSTRASRASTHDSKHKQRSGAAILNVVDAQCWRFSQRKNIKLLQENKISFQGLKI